jgi:hypothetical protein
MDDDQTPPVELKDDPSSQKLDQQWSTKKTSIGDNIWRRQNEIDGFDEGFLKNLKDT